MSLTILAYGGGTNSKALAIEWVQRGLPLDLILFADTGGELPGTYADVQNFSLWLTEHGYPPIVGVQRVRATGEKLTLEQDCLEKHMLPSIAYGYKTCSQKFKVQPQDKYVNNWKPAIEAWARGEKVEKLIGYDAGEERRAKFSSDAKYEYSYPLIEWDYDREDCVRIIKEAGLPLPGKSACFFCPSSKAWEIRALAKEHPEYLARALAIESGAKLTSLKGLGRDWSWADLIDADERQGDLFRASVEVPCGCYDGEYVPVRTQRETE